MTMSRLRLTDRAAVRVSGEDWRGFLQGLLTQDVETLKPGELRYGALLTPQGRLLVDLFIFGTEDGVLLDVATGRREDLIRRLTLYRLRSKVVIAADETGVFAAFGDDPGPGWIADPRLPSLGWRGYGLEAEDTVGREAWDAHRIALAVPDMADFGEDATYPIEANLDLLNAIDFRKGCFVGQETTSRMKRRGTVKSRMLPLRVEGPAPANGAEVLNSELRAGVVASGVEGLALGLMRLDRLDGALTVEGRAALVTKPDWLRSSLPEWGE